MYTGYILVIGFITTLDTVSKIFEREQDEDEEEYEFKEHINEILEQKGYKFINLIYQCCCYHRDDKVFLGIELGHASFIYRNNIEKFNNFQEYDNDTQNELNKIKEFYFEYQDEILNEFKKFSSDFNLIDLNIKPECYKFADDCESCS